MLSSLPQIVRASQVGARPTGREGAMASKPCQPLLYYFSLSMLHSPEKCDLELEPGFFLLPPLKRALQDLLWHVKCIFLLLLLHQQWCVLLVPALAYIETDKKPNLSLFLFFPKCLHFLLDCQVNASGDVSFMANYFAEHFYGICLSWLDILLNISMVFDCSFCRSANGHQNFT